MTLLSRTLPVLLAGSLAAGCAGGSGDYPSLAVRDVERQYGRFLPGEADTPSQPAQPAPIRPGAAPETLAALLADAQASFARFEARESAVAAEVAAARGGGIDSDARAAAITSLSQLSSLRSATAVPLGDLDLLAAKAATTFAGSEEIEETRARVAALVERQDAVLERLWAEMDR